MYSRTGRRKRSTGKRLTSRPGSSGRQSLSMPSFTSGHLLVSTNCVRFSRCFTHSSGVSLLLLPFFFSIFMAKHFHFLDYRFYSLLPVLAVTVVCNFSVCIGVHRLWSHRSFKVTRPLKLALLFFYTMAGQVIIKRNYRSLVQFWPIRRLNDTKVDLLFSFNLSASLY